MKFKNTVQAIMKQNLIAFWASGDPDLIYRFLTAELLECEPTDLLLIHNLLKREVANETDTSADSLSALTKGFFSGVQDVIYGILTERIERCKSESNFIPLGQMLEQALKTNRKVFHKISQMVFHDNRGPEVIERAQKSSIYKYHDEIAYHFQENCEQAQNEANVNADTLDANSGEVPSAIAEIRMIRLIDVVTCYIDATL